MLAAVDFNNHLLLTADKINDEATDGCLAYKLCSAKLPIA